MPATPAAAEGTTPTATTRLAGRLAVAFAALLVVLCLAWELLLAPTGTGTLAVKALPVALAIPGLATERLRTFRWTSLVVWLYACEGLVRATTERGLPMALAWTEVALAVALFAACGAYIRRRMRETASR